MSLGKPIVLYDNLLARFTPTVTSAEADYPSSNLADACIQSFWRATSSADQSITIDAGASVAVDAFCLGPRHNLATVGASVALQYSATGAWGGEQADAFTAFIPAADDSYQHKLFNQVSARYWRVRLTGMSGAPEIGEAAFGARLTLPRHFADGFDDSRALKKTTNTADGGQRESITFHGRRVLPCRIRRVAVGSQAEAEMLAWLSATADGTPFWMLYDLRGAYEAVLVSLPDDTPSAPIDGMRRDFAFTLEEEL